MDAFAKFLITVQDKTVDKFRRAVGANKGDRQTADNEVDGAYDKFRREMVFEGRGKAGDRQLPVEELVAAEQERLSKLEKARVKRMNGEDAADDEVAAAPEGGYSARRLKAKQQVRSTYRRYS